MLAWRSVMIATYKGNYQSFFVHASICQIVFIYDCGNYDANY